MTFDDHRIRARPRFFRVAAVVALVLTLSLLALGLRFWRLGEMPLFGDEAYYLQFIDHPAPAYVDHPIGIAVLLGLSTALGGRTEIGVRWLNAVLGVVCVPLAFAMGRRYVSVGGGLIAAATVAFVPVFVVTGRVTFPDVLHAVLLLVNLLTLAPLLEGEDEGWRWALFGLTLALLLNVKLSSLFYVAGLVLFVLMFRLEWLRSQGFWLAAGIAALGFLPVLAWNAAHSWAGFRWAVAQGNAFGLTPLAWDARLRHAWWYHTPPVIVLGLLSGAGAGLALIRATAARVPRIAASVQTGGSGVAGLGRDLPDTAGGSEPGEQSAQPLTGAAGVAAADEPAGSGESGGRLGVCGAGGHPVGMERAVRRGDGR